MLIRSRLILPRILFLLLIAWSCASSSSSQTSQRKYINPAGDEFPIIAWESFGNSKNITIQNFRNMKIAGFNISLALMGDMNLTYKALEVAKKTGMKIIADCPQTKNPDSIPVYLPKIRNNEALAGYYVTDEPQKKHFEEVKKKCDLIYKYDSIHLPVITLLPMALNPNQTKIQEYRNYLSDFNRIVNLPYFSFDNYPIKSENGKTYVKDNFYTNLEIASEVSRKSERPFWAFCLSAAHFNYPTPTKAALQLEAFSALAYGAQALCYYTYILVDSQSIKYSIAPVTQTGARTKVWYLCRNNNILIQNLKSVFLGCEVQNVWHTGKNLPVGTKRLNKMPGPFISLKSEDEGVLVSHIKNKGKNYLVVVSHDILKPQTVEIAKKDNVKRVGNKGNLIADNNSNFSLEPGGFLIFSW